MLALFASPLGKIAGAALLLAALVGGFKVWLISHDTAVKAALKAELVQFYDQKAAEATAAEQKRQADAAKAATDDFQKQLTDAKAAEAKANADLEKGIAQYEARIADAKRQCALDADDVSAILQLGSGKAGPVGHH
jgi:erythromycin esterase-like protein